jgi:hypothetical protein
MAVDASAGGGRRAAERNGFDHLCAHLQLKGLTVAFAVAALHSGTVVSEDEVCADGVGLGIATVYCRWIDVSIGCETRGTPDDPIIPMWLSECPRSSGVGP